MMINVPYLDLSNIIFYTVCYGTNFFCADKNINPHVTAVSTFLKKLCTWFAANTLFGNLNAHVDITISRINIDLVHVTTFLWIFIYEKCY